jgi:hypothetical protein
MTTHLISDRKFRLDFFPLNKIGELISMDCGSVADALYEIAAHANCDFREIKKADSAMIERLDHYAISIYDGTWGDDDLLELVEVVTFKQTES